MIFLAGVTHDLKTNSLEARWLEEIKDTNGALVELRPFKCRSYAPAQKSDFLADTGVDGQKYVTMAGW